MGTYLAPTVPLYSPSFMSPFRDTQALARLTDNGSVSLCPSVRPFIESIMANALNMSCTYDVCVYTYIMYVYTYDVYVYTYDMYVYTYDMYVDTYNMYVYTYNMYVYTYNM